MGFPWVFRKRRHHAIHVTHLVTAVLQPGSGMRLDVRTGEALRISRGCLGAEPRSRDRTPRFSAGSRETRGAIWSSAVGHSGILSTNRLWAFARPSMYGIVTLTCTP